MKITIEVEMSPQEAREFLGLPNVERIQEQLVKNTEQYLSNASTGQYEEIVKASLQPMLAYQQWLQQLMSTGAGKN